MQPRAGASSRAAASGARSRSRWGGSKGRASGASRSRRTPVYIYSLKEGINDGFLTPFRVKQIQTTLDTYTFTPDDEVVEGEIEAGKVYDEPDFNRSIEIRQREAHRVKLFLEQVSQKEKALVFCANQAHALLVRDLINQQKASTDPNYCHRVTANDGALGEQHLRDFQDNEEDPLLGVEVGHRSSREEAT